MPCPILIGETMKIEEVEVKIVLLWIWIRVYGEIFHVTKNIDLFVKKISHNNTKAVVTIQTNLFAHCGKNTNLYNPHLFSKSFPTSVTLEGQTLA